MKLYTAVIIQLIIWSGYTFIEWLSKYDQLVFKALMFFVFLYLAVIIGHYIIKSTRKTFVATMVSLSVYGSFHVIMTLVV
ncbi:hypothetical protein [Cytobacillus gottheilii]|uniref:hypothetical protein n=1 Tax=Cytobacillus gottheilii TaxID=859144 RepID=UPI0009BA77E8|nr:hypothetical protein [Cytobacillus gottheilii]